MNRSCVHSPRCDASKKEQLLVGDTPRGPNAYGLAGVPETDALKPCNEVDKCFFPRNTRQRPIQPDKRKFETFGATEMLKACPPPHAKAAPGDRMADRGCDPDYLSLVHQEVKAATSATVGTDGEDTLHLSAPRRCNLSCLHTPCQRKRKLHDPVSLYACKYSRRNADHAIASTRSNSPRVGPPPSAALRHIKA